MVQLNPDKMEEYLHTLNVPRDWLTGHLPHQITRYSVGFWGRKTVTCCTCGISTMGGARVLQQLHEQNEIQMRQWYAGIQRAQERMENAKSW